MPVLFQDSARPSRARCLLAARERVGRGAERALRAGGGHGEAGGVVAAGGGLRPVVAVAEVELAEVAADVRSREIVDDADVGEVAFDRARGVEPRAAGRDRCGGIGEMIFADVAKVTAGEGAGAGSVQLLAAAERAGHRRRGEAGEPGP